MRTILHFNLQCRHFEKIFAWKFETVALNHLLCATKWRRKRHQRDVTMRKSRESRYWIFSLQTVLRPSALSFAIIPSRAVRAKQTESRRRLVSQEQRRNDVGRYVPDTVVPRISWFQWRKRSISRVIMTPTDTQVTGNAAAELGTNCAAFASR